MQQFNLKQNPGGRRPDHNSKQTVIFVTVVVVAAARAGARSAYDARHAPGPRLALRGVMEALRKNTASHQPPGNHCTAVPSVSPAVEPESRGVVSCFLAFTSE